MAAQAGMKSFTVEIPLPHIAELERIAQQEDCAVGRLVRIAVKMFLDRYITEEAAHALQENQPAVSAPLPAMLRRFNIPTNIPKSMGVPEPPESESEDDK